LLLPGISLLSEATIDRFVDPGSRRWTWAVAGLVVAVAAAIAGWLLTDSALVPIALGVVAGLVVALASSTLADVAVLMALVAVLGVTPRQADQPGRFTPGDGHHVLVAL